MSFLKCFNNLKIALNCDFDNDENCLRTIIVICSEKFKKNKINIYSDTQPNLYPIKNKRIHKSKYKY